MKTLTIERGVLVFGVAVWWLFFVLLSANQFNPFEILNIIGFLTLSLLPGTLTLIALRLRGLPLWGYIGLAVGFSLLELMVVALIGNTFFPLVGIARPLDSPSLLLSFSILVTVLTMTCYIRIEHLTVPLSFFSSKRDIILAFAPGVFVLMSILGTTRLNNGGSNIITMVMLCTMGLYFALLIYYARRVDEDVIPMALFFMALSLLLMTDMRGWYITGHDIQREYRVFQLAQSTGIWNIKAFPDPYNACLSITILPTVFANLMKVSSYYIYKFFFQIFFAFCPSLTYLITRQLAVKRIALVAGLYFMAVPIFFTDMPFIVRQEIAFLFYGLMLYVIFEKKLDIRIRRIIFMCMGVGVILSHYSTTYTVLFIFGLAAISRPLFVLILRKFGNSKVLRSSPLVTEESSLKQKQKITIAMVVILFLLSFLWTAVITKTAGNVTTVIVQTYESVMGGFDGPNRSIDAMSLLSFGSISQAQELQGYITTVVDPIRASAIPGTYYSEESYSSYPIVTLSDEVTPLTKLGQILTNIGINVKVYLPLFGQLLSKLMEILVPMGLIYLSFKRILIKKIDEEFYLIAFFCVLFVFLNIALPVLSTEYGIFRAMQQSMFVLGVFIAAGSVGIYDLVSQCIKYIVGKRKALSEQSRTSFIFGMGLGVVFFLYSSVFISQLFGGTAAVLHLENSGRYYDNYVTKKTEVVGIDWLINRLPNGSDGSDQVQVEVETDKYTSIKFISVADLDPSNDIFPGLIRKDSYIFLGWGTTTLGRATFFFDGDEITYSYPVAFLDANKNLIYNNGDARVYR
jgi:uncharacterized membrane protein